MASYLLRGKAASRWRYERRVMAAVLAGRFHCPDCGFRGPHFTSENPTLNVENPISFVCPECFLDIPSGSVPGLVLPTGLRGRTQPG